MKPYQEHYLQLYKSFLEMNQKSYKRFCSSYEDCKESYLERKFLNEACDRLIQLREKTEGGRIFQDKFKECLKEEFENARLAKYKKETYVDSFIERDLKNIRKEHIAKYNNADDDYRRNYYCFYDFMINSSRYDVLIYLAEYNVLRNILDNPILLKKKDLGEVNDDQEKDEYSSLIFYPISQLVNSLKQYIQTEDIARLSALFKNGSIINTITIEIKERKYFTRFFGRLFHANLIKKYQKKEFADWLIKSFLIKNNKSKSPQKLKKSSVLKLLGEDINKKLDKDIIIIGLDDLEKN